MPDNTDKLMQDGLTLVKAPPIKKLPLNEQDKKTHKTWLKIKRRIGKNI